MYKAVLIIYLIVFYHGVSAVYCQITDLRRNHLLGKVHTVIQTTYAIENNSNSNQQTISNMVYHYNDSGYVEMIQNYKQDSLFSVSKYSYNNDNELVSMEEYNNDGSIYLTSTYTSNENGHVTHVKYNRDSQKHFDHNRANVDVEYDTYYKKLYTEVDYIVDFKGYILEEIYRTADNSLSHKLIHKYDYKYNRVETKYYNNSGKVSWRKKMKYDMDGNMTSCYYYESNRIALTSEFHYELDQYNNWINRKEVRTLHDNFFSDGLNDNTVITVRKIEYF